MIVAVDIDDVIISLVPTWLHLYNKDYKDNLSKNDITDWQIDKFVKPECGINIYNYKYFYPYNPYDEDKKVKQLFFSDISSETFAIHHWNFSWKLNFFQKVLDFIKKKFRLS